jgi:hypothetical protein
VKPVRELMKDPRVAGGLAALALLFVIYRVTHMGRPAATPARADNGASAGETAVAAPAPADALSAPNGPLAAVALDNGASAALPKGDVAWNWDRNPFIGPPKKGAGAPAAEEVYPKIVVPGFGPKAAPATAPATGEPPVEKASEALPGLRGTVMSGGRGIAVFGAKLVPEGGQLAGWTVERVTAYDVTVSKGSERRTIGLSRLGSPEGKGGKP